MCLAVALSHQIICLLLFCTAAYGSASFFRSLLRVTKATHYTVAWSLHQCSKVWPMYCMYYLWKMNHFDKKKSCSYNFYTATVQQQCLCCFWDGKAAWRIHWSQLGAISAGISEAVPAERWWIAPRWITRLLRLIQTQSLMSGSHSPAEFSPPQSDF